MMTFSQLKAIADALEAKAGASTTANQTETGFWKRIAIALETLTGTSSAANDNINGYMRRAALAIESYAGISSSGKPEHHEAYLARIATAFETKNGSSYLGSVENRLVQGSSNLSTAFTPASLSPAVWYDPSDLSTLFQSGTRASPGAAVTTVGQTVGLILDKSGNQFDLTQATASSRPTYQVDGNGKPHLLFDGVDDRLSSGGATIGGNTHTIGAAALATAASKFLWTVAVSATDKYALEPSNSAGVSAIHHTNASTTAKTSSTGIDTAQVLLATIDKVTPATSMRVNSAAQSGTLGTAASSTVGSILGASTGVTALFTGRFYGLVDILRTLTNTERGNLETWLGAKCGLTL